jgi:hypothetical protein
MNITTTISSTNSTSRRRKFGSCNSFRSFCRKSAIPATTMTVGWPTVNVAFTTRGAVQNSTTMHDEVRYPLEKDSCLVSVAANL